MRASFEPLLAALGKLELDDIRGAIVFGESGPKSPPMNREWVTECSMTDTSRGPYL